MSGRLHSRAARLILVLVLLAVAYSGAADSPAEARRHHGSHASHGSGRHSHRKSAHASRGSRRGHRGRAVASRHGHGRRGRHRHHHHIVHRPRYAYPVDMFMLRAPDFDVTPLPADQAGQVADDFRNGLADKYPARTLVKAGVVKYHPLRGGIFWRREPVKYIIMHSTETGIPVGAVNVIEGWSSLGRRHPGAQYVVDRDGTIYQSVDPDLATVHINILKTLPGINNDNSIGIEINHTGSQAYPEAQLQSVIRLVTYLQDRYQVQNENIVTHRYAQRGDHTDPVHFDWTGFLASKDRHRNHSIALKMSSMEKQSQSWGDYTDEVVPSTYLLQPHAAFEPKPPRTTSGAPVPNAPGAVMPGQVTTGAVTPNAVMPGQVTTGSVTPGAVRPALLTPGIGSASARSTRATFDPAAQFNKPTLPAIPSLPINGPVNSQVNNKIDRPNAALPPGALRGPIEVGPEHADDLKNVMPSE